MKNRGKILSIILMMTMVLIAGCGSKDQPKEETQAAGSELLKTETVQENAGSEKEASKNIGNAEGIGSAEDASKGEDIDYLAIHGATLDRIYSWTMEGTEGAHITDGEQVIIDAVKSMGEYARYDLGYALAEVNEDGIVDLVIGQPHQDGIGNMIYAIYTWKDGNFQCNAKGAEYTKFCPGSINEEEVLYLSPFSNYEPGMKLEADVDTPSMEIVPVCVQWMEDTYLEPNGYDVFTADDLAEQRQVVFIAVFKVSDFKVLSLSFESADDNGNIKYATEVLYGQSELIPERPLMVGMSCDSTIPCYGISYVDENGVNRNFAVEVSGMDGSILLSEF